MLAGISEDAFDVIYMVDVIHHIHDIQTMFRSIHKALKDGGKVFVFTDTHERIKYERLTSKYFPETVEVELKRYQSDRELDLAMEQAGFTNRMLEYIGELEPVDFGQRLIDLAATKGYSMFHLIPQEAIDRGIEKLKEDIEKGPFLNIMIIYNIFNNCDAH